jgi:formate dehydrogenase major subunit
MVFGNGLTSTAQTMKVKEALDNLELIVLADPFVNEGAIITDKQNDVYILPAATQFETSGSVTATNRSAQWRYKVIEPMYESKPDHEIWFELAKRLGFYNEYIAGMGKGDKFVWPDDATDEIARTVKTIGLTGWTAKRLKNHTDNWHMFDEVSLRGYGKMAGEYYGLPWPCWTDSHSGSPVLYNINLPVKEGGMGFRNRFGLEHNGQDLLSAKGSAPKDSKVKGGYPEITKENIEKVLNITLTAEEKAAMGANWKVDTSNIIAQKCMEAGIAPYGNAKARAKVWGWADEIPMHREPLHSPRTDLTKSYPSFADKKDHWRVDTRFVSEQSKQDWAKDFPVNLVTGRLVNLNGAGIENRASKYLAKLTPEMFCDINPDLAGRYGIRDGSMMWIHSPQGTKIKVKAKYSHSVAPDRVFLPFHFAGVLQGVDLSHKYPTGTKPYAIGESANVVTNYGYDIVTQIPETKGGLCQIQPA